MHITVTGSHGFIGNHLVNYLMSQGHNLSCWDLQIGKNIKDFTVNGFLENTTDIIIHLAALAGVRQSFETPNQYWKVNVEHSKKIFEVATISNVKVIYASTSSCLEWYNNPYAITKYVTEFIAPTNSIGLRFSTVWGDGARGDMLIPQIKNKTLKYATSHKRDFIHVSDVVSAIQTIINHPDETGIFEVGSGMSVAVDQLVAFNGLDVPILPGKHYEIDDNCLPSHRLRSLGWKPTRFIMDEKL